MSFSKLEYLKNVKLTWSPRSQAIDVEDDVTKNGLE